MNCYCGETAQIEWKFLDYRRKLLEIWWEPEAEIAAEKLFKISEILPLMARYVYTVTVFVVNSREYWIIWR